MRDEDMSGALLAWYDRHARDLPWRVSPQDRAAGVAPDPYRVWLSEIMLQQTTVAAVRAYFERFTHAWPNVAALAQARDEDVMAAWAGLGYYARARNLLACARAVMADHAGQFPSDEAGLLSLPGIGPYTAAAIAAIAHDRPAVVMDGNVERVMARIFARTDPLPRVKPTLKADAARLTPQRRAGDYAQAVMDLGATICTPRAPACGICPWRTPCAARAQGIAATLPAKEAKTAKPIRHGHIFVARRQDGAVLVETRPPQGLLGGMMGFPTSDWVEIGQEIAATPPAKAAWRDSGQEVRHTFTHFHLRLRVFVADLGMEAVAIRGAFLPQAAFRPAALPTVMRKAYDLAQA